MLAGSTLLRVGIPSLAAVAGAACTARDNNAAFEIFTTAEAVEFDSVAARILPATDTPGASEAGVVHFMDKSFGSIMKDKLSLARSGLATLQSDIQSELRVAILFSELEADDQDRYLRVREDSQFFELMRFMTIAGFFSMSSYGGNRNNIGWKLLGIDHQHQVWNAPFGYYDAEYMRDESNGS